MKNFYLNIITASIPLYIFACGEESGIGTTELDVNTNEASVVGGLEAPINGHPFLVHVDAGRFDCGGSLISRDWVLTAAHCVDGIATGDVSVRVGEHSLGRVEPSEATISAQRVVVHPSYSPSTLDNDIALIELSTPATLSDRVQTIRLNRRRRSTSGNIRVIGWGRNFVGNRTPDIAQTDVPLQVDLPIVTSSAFCQESDSVLCAGVENTPTDSCGGDSGGPLFTSNGQGQPLQRALVSSGSAACDGGSRNTRVSFYADFISRTTGI